MNTNSHTELVGRRSELMAELFLQELGASFVARPTADFGYDFVVAFPNSKRGVNTFGIEVKGTEDLSSHSFPIAKRLYERLAYSNIPGLLLVVDVKRNRLFYSWPNRNTETPKISNVKVPLIEIDEKTKNALRKRLTASNP